MKTFTVERPEGHIVVEYRLVKCLESYGPSLEAVLSELNAVKEAMPPDSVAGAQVFLREELDYGTSTLLLEIRYERPETEEETRERLDREAEKVRQEELLERQEYAKLRAKYGETI